MQMFRSVLYDRMNLNSSAVYLVGCHYTRLQWPSPKQKQKKEKVKKPSGVECIFGRGGERGGVYIWQRWGEGWSVYLAEVGRGVECIFGRGGERGGVYIWQRW